MKFNKVMSFFCAMLVTCSGMVMPVSAEGNNTMRDISTMDLVEDMGIGINLGNTFESCGTWIDKSNATVTTYETAWGSPVITKDMIKGYANEGFGVLRIPVAWSNMMDDSYNIDSSYIDRVKEVVDWTVDSGMYAIVNIHYDSGWFSNFSTDKSTCMTKYSKVWTQVADAFKSYGDYVMFESLNEEGCWNDIWNRYSGGTDGKETAYGLLNEINQTFVDIVRASGGNNAKRHLLIAGYATDIDLTCDSMFKMPNDSANRCAVSVHYYTPSTFAILEEDADWGQCSSTWGTDAEVAELKQNMEKMKTNFIDKGIPVILGEYGCPTNNKEAESVRLFLSSVCKEAFDRDICPVLWDTTDLHYSRTSCTLKDQSLKEIFCSIAGTGFSNNNSDNNVTDDNQNNEQIVPDNNDVNNENDNNDINSENSSDTNQNNENLPEQDEGYNDETNQNNNEESDNNAANGNENLDSGVQEDTNTDISVDKEQNQDIDDTPQTGDTAYIIIAVVALIFAFIKLRKYVSEYRNI